MLKNKFAYGALAALALVVVMGASGGGFPSRPKLQSLGVGVAAPAGTGNAAVNGNLTVGGTAGVTGNATVGGTATVTGNTTLSADAAVGGALTVTGAATVGGIPVMQTGSFTATLTGYASNPTGTIQYRRSGNLVTLFVPADISGTSNSTGMTITGLPAGIQPATAQMIPVHPYRSNGFPVAGFASFAASSGTITCFMMTVSGTEIRQSGVAFAGSGTKGLVAGWTATYALN